MKVLGFIFRFWQIIKGLFKAGINFFKGAIKDWKDFAEWEKSRKQ